MFALFIAANLIISKFLMVNAIRVAGSGKEEWLSKNNFLRQGSLRPPPTSPHGKYSTLPSSYSSVGSAVLVNRPSSNEPHRKIDWDSEGEYFPTNSARRLESQHNGGTRKSGSPTIDVDKYLEVMGPGLFQIPLILSLMPFALPALPLMIWAQEYYEGHQGGAAAGNTQKNHAFMKGHSMAYGGNMENISAKSQQRRQLPDYLQFESKKL